MPSPTTTLSPSRLAQDLGVRDLTDPDQGRHAIQLLVDAAVGQPRHRLELPGALATQAARWFRSRTTTTTPHPAGRGQPRRALHPLCRPAPHAAQPLHSDDPSRAPSPGGRTRRRRASSSAREWSSVGTPSTAPCANAAPARPVAHHAPATRPRQDLRRDGRSAGRGPHTGPALAVGTTRPPLHPGRTPGGRVLGRRVGRGGRVRPRPSRGARTRRDCRLERPRPWHGARPPAHAAERHPRHPLLRSADPRDRRPDDRPGAATGRCRRCRRSVATSRSPSRPPTPPRTSATASATPWARRRRRRGGRRAGRDTLRPAPTPGRRPAGHRPHQKNVLVRVVLRHLERTLTDEEANRLRDRVYAALHQGSVHQWAARSP